MNQNKGLTRARPRGVSYNVYSVYLDSDHKILGSCRTMCIPFIGTANHTFSNPHQLTWSQLQARSAASEKEPFLDTVIGGAALVFLFIAISLI